MELAQRCVDKSAVLRDLLLKGLAVAGGFLAITAVQFAHNITTTGELLPMGPIRTLLPGLIRPEALSLGELGGGWRF